MERNFYVGKRSEINLCVHFNRRVSGKYVFIPEYRYYITDGRCSLELHHNLGYLDEKDIIECFDSIEAARESEYYKDFCELKEKIDKEIERQKKLECKFLGSMHYSIRYDEEKNQELAVYETMSDKECFVQYHVLTDVKEGTEEWKISKSDVPILELWRYFKDFYELDEKELHLLQYLPMDGNTLSETSEYYSYYKKVRDEIDNRGMVIFD